MLQEPIKIQLSHKGTTLTIKVERSAVHKLIGSNKISANKKEKELEFNSNTIDIPKNGTSQNTINCNTGLSICCNQRVTVQN